MNKRIKELAKQAGWSSFEVLDERNQKFAELIVEECRTVIAEQYHQTSLELCGPLLTADEKIAEHFYGVEK